MADERIKVYAYVTDGAGKAKRMDPPTVSHIIGEVGSNKAMAKTRSEFEARGYRVRSLSWRVGGGVIVHVLGQRQDPTKPAVKV